MFERFTDRARRVLMLAQDEAKAFGHAIGVEHLLIGCAAEGGGVAALVLAEGGATTDALRDALRARRPALAPVDTADALSSVGVELARVQAAVEQSFGADSGFRAPKPDTPPFDDDAKRTLEGALQEALGLNHNYIGTEHLLLAILNHAADDGRLALATVGADLDRMRAGVIAVVGAISVMSAETASKDAQAIRRGVQRLPDESRTDARAVVRETIDGANEQLLADIARLGRVPDAAEMSGLLEPTARAIDGARGRLDVLGVLRFVDIVAELIESEEWSTVQSEQRRVNLRVGQLKYEAEPEVLAAAVRDRMEALSVEAAMWQEVWDRHADADLPTLRAIVAATAARVGALGTT